MWYGLSTASRALRRHRGHVSLAARGKLARNSTNPAIFQVLSRLLFLIQRWRPYTMTPRTSSLPYPLAPSRTHPPTKHTSSPIPAPPIPHRAAESPLLVRRSKRARCSPAPSRISPRSRRRRRIFRRVSPRTCPRQAPNPPSPRCLHPPRPSTSVTAPLCPTPNPPPSLTAKTPPAAAPSMWGTALPYRTPSPRPSPTPNPANPRPQRATRPPSARP
ncbi:hypothetical protein C8F04DRAFT_1245664, partial [Mycena alexandri]